jgi:hypothetical protein
VKINFFFKIGQQQKNIWNILRIFYFHSGMLKIHQYENICTIPTKLFGKHWKYLFE